jgi:hypothetical protein
MLVTWRASLLFKEVTDNVPIKVCAVRIRLHKLGILIGRESKVTIDGATAELEIQQLLAFGVSNGDEKTGVQKHPGHRHSFSSIVADSTQCGLLERAHR